MDKFCVLLVFLLLLHSLPPIEAAYGGGGVGFGMGGSGAGSRGGWFVGGTSGVPRAMSGSSPSKLKIAYTALQAWKSAITEDPMGILSTWVGSNVCSYKGVFCSDRGTGPGSEPFVSGIDLNHGNLKGVLVKDLSLLTDLTLLHLNSNRFSGSVPSTFADLASLQELDLSNNNFSGNFPGVVLNMPSLIYLDLRYNNFSGIIPEETFIGNLDAIILNNNHFQGEIPDTLGNSQASVISLANNRFSGAIPSLYGSMASRIKEILLLNNNLSGCIPPGVGLFMEAKVFDVSRNSLTGQLPASLSCLDQIEVLNLGHNRFSGVLPDVVCSLSHLVNLTVSYNFFSGLSQECSELPGRNVGFDFADNCIPNIVMQRPLTDCNFAATPGAMCLHIPSRGCGSMYVFPSNSSAADSPSTSP